MHCIYLSKANINNMHINFIRPYTLGIIHQQTLIFPGRTSCLCDYIGAQLHPLVYSGIYNIGSQRPVLLLMSLSSLFVLRVWWWRLGVAERLWTKLAWCTSCLTSSQATPRFYLRSYLAAARWEWLGTRHRYMRCLIYLWTRLHVHIS